MIRMRVPELMDDPNLAPGLHADALKGLDTLNDISFTADILWKELKSLSEMRKASANQQQGNQPIKVLDLATGSGDTLLRLAKIARHHNDRFEFVGTDFSPTAVQVATERAELDKQIVRFEQLNVLTDPLPRDFDVIMTSLFIHHLDPEQVVTLLEGMRESGAKLILVNDLLRSSLSWILVWLGTRIFSRSPIVHFDGPASVRASYTRQELLSMASQAGLASCQIKSLWPCRQLLVWRKEG